MLPLAAAHPAPSHPSHPHTRHAVGSLFSQISGKFSKSLIFGCFFPVVFFVLLDWILFTPYAPPAAGVVEALTKLEKEWRTLAIGGLTVLFSGLLYILNTPIIRFYEGYPWEHSHIGGVFKRREVRRLQEMTDWVAALNALLGAGVRDRETKKALTAKLDALERSLGVQFSSRKGSILPTRLGNVIRSFEDYPNRQYGMAAITLWPRLVAVIDPKYAESADDAKSSFDFMIHASFLSAASAAGLLLLGLTSPDRPDGRELWGWLLQVGALALFSWVFYRGSIARAQEWGDMVRGAFDLYRGKLLTQLGFQKPPRDLAEERRLWKNISEQMIYGDPLPATGRALLRFDSGGTWAVGNPATVALQVSRSTKEAADGWHTCLAVLNPDLDPVKNVRVIDPLPEGERYVWSSALSEGEPLRVTGTDPIAIELGTLAGREQRIVVYRTHK